jgi:excisionase family DNA binding protein
MSETIIHSDRYDLEQIDAVRGQIDALLQQRPPYTLLGELGYQVELPASVVEALRMVVEAMVRGQSITLISQAKELTSQEAADLIGVSRPYLIKLLERGEIPFHRVGTHRRLKIEDVLAYRDRRDIEQRAALNELTRLSEELPGGYR